MIIAGLGQNVYMPSSREVIPLERKVGEVARQVLEKVLVPAGHLIGKCIVIPILLTAVMVVTAITVLSLLIYPFKPQAFASLSTLLSDMTLGTILFAKFGMKRAKVTLQYADDLPDSPQFHVVMPKELNPEAVPIVYAPGYLSGAEDLYKDGKALANKTGAPVYLVQYRSLFQSITKHARDIARVTQRMYKDTGKKEGVFIGHSMGGLTTRRCIQSEIPHIAVKLWVTIASPLDGTLAAHLAIGKCARQMRPGSTFLKKAKALSALEHIPSLHIYTPRDPVVPPHSATRLSRINAEHYECTLFPYGHLGVRSCDPVLQAIVKAYRGIILR